MLPRGARSPRGCRRRQLVSLVRGGHLARGGTQTVPDDDPVPGAGSVRGVHLAAGGLRVPWRYDPGCPVIGKHGRGGGDRATWTAQAPDRGLRPGWFTVDWIPDHSSRGRPIDPPPQGRLGPLPTIALRTARPGVFAPVTCFTVGHRRHPPGMSGHVRRSCCGLAGWPAPRHRAVGSCARPCPFPVGRARPPAAR